LKKKQTSAAKDHTGETISEGPFFHEEKLNRGRPSRKGIPRGAEAPPKTRVNFIIITSSGQKKIPQKGISGEGGNRKKGDSSQKQV